MARASAPAAAVARSLWVAVAQSTAPWQAGRTSSRPPADAGSAAARSALARTRTVTAVGGPASAGATRANSSSRSPGFSTRPTTVRARPSRATVPPTPVWKVAATASVTATSPAAEGQRPARSASIGLP